MSHFISITVVLQDHSNLIASFVVQRHQHINDVKATLSAQWGIDAASLSLKFNGNLLNDHQTLSAVGINDNDLLQAEVMRQPTSMLGAQEAMISQIRSQAQALRNRIRTDLQLQNELNRSNPMLLQSALSDNPSEFENLIIEQQRMMMQQQIQEAQRLAALDSDPLNEENQRLIEQEIRQVNIERNLAAAMEHNPEAFAKVCMLYVNLRLGNKQVTALVDSGAQSTVMSLECAERLGILHLLDRRFAGVARGAGTSNIIGRIHYVEVQLGSHYLAVTLSVLDSLHIDFLWGLDMLKKHRMCIDLEKDCLRIGEDEVPFLKEHELPESVQQFEEEQKSSSGTPTAANRLGASSSSQGALPSTVSDNNATNLNQVKEEDIAILVGLGFTRQQAASALEACHGNVDLAAGMLFH